MNGQPIRLRVDGYTRSCLTVLALLLAVLIVGLWAQQVPLARPAGAADQFGDTGGRIALSLEEQKLTNARLDQLLKLLTSGQVKVQLVGAPGPASRDPNAPPAPPAP